jgi:hypothetical protein
MAQAVAVAAKGDEVVVVGGANGETSPAAIIWSNHQRAPLVSRRRP